jgi:hypothetical protein
MSSTSLARRLQIKPGNHVLILDAPPGYVDALDDLPAGVKLAHAAKGHFDVVHAFVRTSKDVDKRLPVAVKSMKPGGVLWFSWPKQTSKLDTDLNRDSLNDLAREHGLRAVASIAVDDTWSALRFKLQ